MPKRPRQHDLDELSRRSFSTAIPSGFVFEDRTNDYGIDGSVEIFRDGSTTGEFFDVQLKGTDRPLAQALKVYVPHDHAQYYRSLDRPLLMVHYHAPIEKLYVRWFHSLDPHYGGVNEKTITFTWAPEDVWSEDTSDRLEAAVTAFRRFRAAALELPVRFGIHGAQEHIHGVDGRDLVRAVRSELNFVAEGLIRAHPRRWAFARSMADAERVCRE